MYKDLAEKYYDMIDGFAESHRADMVENLSKLLMFNTVSGSNKLDEKRLFRNEVSRGFSFLRGLARDMGFEYRSYNSKVGVIEQVGGVEVIGVPLHIDVVPSGEGWTFPAFGGMVENDVIYGRGAQDDKGPIIQMLYALYIVRSLRLPFGRTVRLIVASQEETGDWSDVKNYLSMEPSPEFSIVPDSNFPIVNGEKGMVDIEIRLSWEKTDGQQSIRQFNGLRGGERSNIVPNRAELSWNAPLGSAKSISQVLTRHLETFLKENPKADTFPLRVAVDPERESRELHLTFLGTSAHGSTPEKGHNAILDALRFLSVVPEMPRSLISASDFLVSSCGDHLGSGLGIKAEHDKLGQTTVNLGMLRMSGNEVTATLNIRPTYGQSCAQVLQAIRNKVNSWSKQSGIQATTEFSNEPYEALYVDPKKQPDLIQALQASFEKVTGDEATLKTIGGTTFAKAFPNAVSFGPTYPKTEKELFHQADENITVEQLMRNVKIYSLALMLLAVDWDKSSTSGSGMGLGL